MREAAGGVVIHICKIETRVADGEVNHVPPIEVANNTRHLSHISVGESPRPESHTMGSQAQVRRVRRHTFGSRRRLANRCLIVSRPPRGGSYDQVRTASLTRAR